MDADKALRLSGMLETIDARLAQAHGGELGHLDFLQVLKPAGRAWGIT
ncbi:hypothetical protein ACF9IK_00480 [Kitasatospora hibisci]